MDLPAKVAVPVASVKELESALGVKAVYTGRSQFDYVIEVESEDAVRRIAPDFSALRKTDARGVIVTSLASTPGYDFISRFLRPARGLTKIR